MYMGIANDYLITIACCQCFM